MRLFQPKSETPEDHPRNGQVMGPVTVARKIAKESNSADLLVTDPLGPGKHTLPKIELKTSCFKTHAGSCPALHQSISDVVIVVAGSIATLLSHQSRFNNIGRILMFQSEVQVSDDISRISEFHAVVMDVRLADPVIQQIAPCTITREGLITPKTCSEHNRKNY